MNFKKIVCSYAVASAFLAFGSSSAFAVAVTNVSPNFNLNTTAIGTGIPQFGPGIGGSTGVFDNYFLFQLSLPASGVSSTVNFNPVGGVTGFTGSLYSVTGTPSGGSATLGTQLASYSSTSATEVTLGWTALTAGYYVVRLQGNAVNAGATISGQVSTVPAPAVLGLVGLGLVGVGFFGSRRRG
jgi:hypothetical protein